MKQQIVKRTLTGRPDINDLQRRGVLVSAKPEVATTLQPRMKKLKLALRQALLNRQLHNRMNITDLQGTGVMKGMLILAIQN